MTRAYFSDREALRVIGVRDFSKVARSYSELPCVTSVEKWTMTNAFFKGEKGVLNIGLGRGAALETFNQNIISYRAIPR
jgi:hypothetical protein